METLNIKPKKTFTRKTFARAGEKIVETAEQCAELRFAGLHIVKQNDKFVGMMHLQPVSEKGKEGKILLLPVENIEELLGDKEVLKALGKMKAAVIDFAAKRKLFKV